MAEMRRHGSDDLPQGEPVTDLVLDISASVVLDASGNGTVQLGPKLVREHWQPASASVSVNDTSIESFCSVFLGSTVLASQMLSTTRTGSSGDTCTIAGIDLQPGMLVIAQWLGGKAGATATMRVIGTRSRPTGK